MIANELEFGTKEGILFPAVNQTSEVASYPVTLVDSVLPQNVARQILSLYVGQNRVYGFYHVCNICRTHHYFLSIRMIHPPPLAIIRIGIIRNNK